MQTTIKAINGLVNPAALCEEVIEVAGRLAPNVGSQDTSEGLIAAKVKYMIVITHPAWNSVATDEVS